MVDHWDNKEPMHAVIVPSLADEEPEVNNKLGALMFLLWSAFMMSLGFMIAMMVQGHIVIK
jgi:hypothetical protein